MAKKRQYPETDLQIAIMRFVFAKQAQYPILRLLYHPKNGGQNTRAEAGLFQAMGVRKGVSDLHLPVCSVSGDFIGLWLELKSGRNGLTEDQYQWCKAMIEQGHNFVTVRTVYQAVHAIAGHLGFNREWDHELQQLKAADKAT